MRRLTDLERESLDIGEAKLPGHKEKKMDLWVIRIRWFAGGIVFVAACAAWCEAIKAGCGK